MRMFVQRVLDDTISVEVGAFLEAFVFALPAVLFRLDMRMSCEKWLEKLSTAMPNDTHEQSVPGLGGNWSGYQLRPRSRFE